MHIFHRAFLAWAFTAGALAVAADKPQPESPHTIAKKVDLNAATEAELQALPGVGPVYAKQIIAGRPYQNVKDLEKVGIPEAAIERIGALVVIEKEGPPFIEGEKNPPPTPTLEEQHKGQVWMDNATQKYFKEGSPHYGKTTDGKFVTEDAAIESGATFGN